MTMQNSSHIPLSYTRSVTTEAGATLYLPKPMHGTYRHAYLLREDLLSNHSASIQNEAPATLSLEETWQQGYPGVYVFFPYLPASEKDQKGFVTAAANQLKHPDRDKVRFAWFDKPSAWETGLFAPGEIQVIDSGDNVKNSQQYAFSLGRYSLRISKANRIFLNNRRNGFIFESGKSRNSFGAGKRTQLENPLELVLGEEQHQACFRFMLNMSGAELAALDVSLNYYWKDQRWGHKRLRYPVFETHGQAGHWALMGVFDPLDPLNNKNSQKNQAPEDFADLRTGLAFVSDSNGKNSLVPLPSYFRTRYGKSIELLPVTSNDNRTALRLPAMLTFNQDAGKDKFSVVLQGDFHLRVAHTAKRAHIDQHHLLCGLSGTETISFKSAAGNYPGDIIRFHPRKPAFSPSFPIIDKNRPADISADVLLNHDLTTAWISIRTHAETPISDNFYYSQPQEAPLFKATDESGDRLDVFDAPSANLAHSDMDRDCYPLVPAAAAPMAKKTEKVHRENFEFQILNPTRKHTIERYTTDNRPLFTQSAQADPDPNKKELTTTPQGVLVAFDKMDVSNWQSLILANDQTAEDPIPLELKQPPSYVQSAFQTNEQFLVISNPARETLEYLRQKFANRVTVAQWSFLLDVVGNITNSNTSTEFRNVLIFKFCKHSLVDRLENPELWTQPDTFNNNSQLQELAQWIKKYIDAVRPAKTSASNVQQSSSIIQQGYKDFIDKVDDPSWNGILALQVTLDLAQLPEAIKSIVAGIDISRFAAHHIGINSNQIVATKGRLDPNFKSSMFGLISYFDTEYQEKRFQPKPSNQKQNSDSLLPVSGDFDFKVLALQVLFKNSEILDFNCKIQLSINTLFNEPVIAESTPNNAINKFSIVLEGLYDRQDGHTSYTFRQLADHSLQLHSTALHSVTVQRVALSTVHAKQTADIDKTSPEPNDDAVMTTRFALTGRLKMRALKDFDMLSYDGISFSALYIDMQFSINAPQRSKRFRFIPTDIVLNPTESEPRSDSLVAHFPITLQSLKYFGPPPTNISSPAVMPSSIGYQNVEAPLNYNPIKSTWYALQFNLNLGTMGSLAAKAGFDAKVLLAWSPGIKNSAAQIWVKTPFTGGGGKQFSLQGVLKLVTQSIRLEKQPGKPEYAMLFTNIKVSLLGLKFPRSGNTLLYLFGNPNESSTGDAASIGNLGWFGAYKQNKKKEGDQKTDPNSPETILDIKNTTPLPQRAD